MASSNSAGGYGHPDALGVARMVDAAAADRVLVFGSPPPEGRDLDLLARESEKKALCPIDTMRWILSDGVTGLPYGHWSIMVYKNMVKDGIPHDEAEKRAIRAKLPEKYQNECTSHIASSLYSNPTEITEAKELSWLD